MVVLTSTTDNGQTFNLLFPIMTFPQTGPTTLKRLPKRGHYERETVYGILDEGFICHVGLCCRRPTGRIPTAMRVWRQLYIPRLSSRRMLRTLAAGV